MRVVLVSYYYPPSIGGVERQSELLASGLVERGHSVDVVTARMPSASLELADTHLRIHRVSAGSGSRWHKMATYIVGMLRTTLRIGRHADVVHVQQALYPAAAMVLASMRLRIPLVVTNHGSGATGAVQLMQSLPFGRAALGLIRAHATCVAVSRPAARELEQAGFNRVRYIPNGVRIPPAISAEERVSARTALGVDGQVILFVGRLESEKNVELLIRACQRMQSADARLLIVGDGPRRRDLEAIAKHSAAIRFYGALTDTRPFLAAADAFVLPSLSEGMPIALLEAMAAGLPAVATDVDGSHDLLSSEDLGVLVPSDDVSALACALERLQRAPRWAAEMGHHARQHVIDCYSAEAMVKAHEQLYRSLGAGWR